MFTAWRTPSRPGVKTLPELLPAVILSPLVTTTLDKFFPTPCSLLSGMDDQRPRMYIPVLFHGDEVVFLVRETLLMLLPSIRGTGNGEQLI